MANIWLYCADNAKIITIIIIEKRDATYEAKYFTTGSYPLRHGSGGSAFSTGEIFDLARDKIPRLGIATIYRTLKSLKEEGAIREVDLPGQSSRWELANKDHHHHFLCRTCDKLFEIEGCPGRSW